MARRVAPHQWLFALALSLGLLPFSCAGQRCNGSQLVSPADRDQCAGDEPHRADKRACAPGVPKHNVCRTMGPPSYCAVDADCVAKANGYCEGPPAMLAAPCQCDYGCIRDADCGKGWICECGDSGGKCVTASCTADGDCKSGLCLSVWTADCVAASQLYACVTPQDECTKSSDCGDGACRWERTRRRCMYLSECGGAAI